MRTLVLDIETIGDDWEDFDERSQELLLGGLTSTKDGIGTKENRVAEVAKQFGLSPFTGKILALGLYDVERSQGAVYMTHYGDDSVEADNQFVFKKRNEAAILSEFWSGATDYDVFVTFGGRSFDVPFLLHRSVACGVSPSVDLMKYRYLSQQSHPFHIDLQDELSFYGSLKKVSMHQVCRTYNIDSPKINFSGADIDSLYKQKRYRDIACYNKDDVLATASVYKKWLNNLAPESFLSLKDIF